LHFKYHFRSTLGAEWSLDAKPRRASSCIFGA
jgi:hypothetical protein